MQYRTFGKLGFKVSALGFGAMRLPSRDEKVDVDAAVTLIRRAIDLGVNYVDTAPLYNHNQSETVVGLALMDGYRRRVWLSTKNLLAKDDDEFKWRRRLDDQLKLLRVDYVDVYHCWGIGWEPFRDRIAAKGILDVARRAQGEGLFRHLFFSFHAPAEDLVRLVDTGEFEGCTVQYNLVDRRYEEGLAYAASKGLATVVMGPVGGGRLAGPSRVFRDLKVKTASTPELALRFVLANPNVQCAISGMSDLAMLSENVVTASRSEPLSRQEAAALEGGLAEYRRLADLYCTACGYCEPCPADIPIGRCLQLYGLARVYGLDEAARKLYYEIGRSGFFGKKSTAAACNACGKCEAKCPQGLDVVEELAAAHAALSRD